MRGFRALGLTVIVFAMGVGFATAQSLAELAKKEKERRDANPTETKRVVTDRELTRGYGESPSGLRQAGAQAQDGAGAAAAASDTEESEEQQDETQTKEHWQNRVKAVQDKIARLEQQMTSDDWGDGQRVGIDPRGQNSLASREKASQELAAARSELEAIRVEARKASVPPGWVR
jgi:hypothetical protein